MARSVTIIFQDLIVERNSLVFALVIILFVTVDIAYGFYRIHHVTGEVLKEIENIRKEEQLTVYN